MNATIWTVYPAGWFGRTPKAKRHAFASNEAPKRGHSALSFCGVYGTASTNEFTDTEPNILCCSRCVTAANAFRAGTPCERCGQRLATTHQEHREPGDPEHWANDATNRCDDCAQDLRDYAALSSISLKIKVDRPFEESDAPAVMVGEAV